MSDGKARAIAIYKDGSFVDTDVAHVWEDQNDPEWERTITEPEEIQKFLSSVPIRVVTQLTFGAALQALKDGYRVTRVHWNADLAESAPENIWLVLVHIGSPGQLASAGTIDLGAEGLWALNSFIAVKTSSDRFGPWSPTQCDLLADDWKILDRVVKATKEQAA